MNHIFRVIFNESSQTWVAVAETTRSRRKGKGKCSSKVMFAALLAFECGISPAFAATPATTVTPTGGKANAYISANGVPVVNIEAANSKGLSHNRYNRYDVQKNGLVLNNGNRSQLERQSQLAGRVSANLNLVKEAKVILNEVVSTSRSTLAGFTEVLGGQADVIVANPNGITCNGCGFINTDRATLTTGNSNISAEGNLTGFTVNKGDVLIKGTGANASTQKVFDIVARSVKIDGRITGNTNSSLGITAGANKWDYAGRKVTGQVAGVGPKPSYAIDSTALGGMYAGRINLIATEAGVGVRMLGDAAASTEDFSLNSAGKIEIKSAVSAKRDVAIVTKSATGNKDLFINTQKAKVSAGRDLALTAKTGEIQLSEAELYAAMALTLEADTLNDVSTAKNTRYAGTNNTITTSGAAKINGSEWGAKQSLSGTFDSLSIGNTGAKLYAGSSLGLSASKYLELETAAIQSINDMLLNTDTGAITTKTGTDQGIQVKNGDLLLTAGDGLLNAGIMTADEGSVYSAYRQQHF